MSCAKVVARVRFLSSGQYKILGAIEFVRNNHEGRKRETLQRRFFGPAPGDGEFHRKPFAVFICPHAEGEADLLDIGDAVYA